jgi:hypothetical protein
MFVLGKPYQPSLIFVGKARTSTSDGVTEGALGSVMSFLITLHLDIGQIEKLYMYVSLDVMKQTYLILMPLQ